MVIIRMRKNTILKNIFFIVPFFISVGCLKDDTNPVDSFIPNDSIDMLVYLETNGDIINSPTTKNVFTSAQELYSNLSGYVVLDIRDSLLFADGHISGAINIQSSDLLAKVKSLDTSKVILVSQNGQSASYYGSLLIIDGFSNINILEFGMAGWNDHFADNWRVSNGYKPLQYNYFNSIGYNKGPITNFPEVKINSSGDIKSKIETRIQDLLSEEFEDGINYIKSSSLPSIYSQDTFGDFLLEDSTFENEYIICYDTQYVYILPGHRDGTMPVHPPHSILYNYYKDLKSIYYLQTIPVIKKVVVYSLSGHQSAFATAYLRLLGYTNVHSLLFGATWLSPFPGSMNYPYVN